MNSLGQRLREFRMKRKLTQIELASGICTPSMISQIEADKARPSYKVLFSIAERLGVSMEALFVDVEMNLDYISTYKMARAMVAAKEYAAAVPLLRDILDTQRASIPTMDILYELGECLYQTGELEEAERTYKRVQEYAVMSNDPLMAAKVMMCFGRIASERKLYQIAKFHFQKALDETGKMEEIDVCLQAHILQALGAVAGKLGETVGATDYLMRAAGLYERVESLSGMARVYLELGVAFRQLGDLKQASENTERAHAIFRGLEEAQVALHLEIETAALYGATGRVDEAEQLLGEALLKAGQMQDREAQGMIYCELAQVYYQKGELEIAVEHCGQASFLLPELHRDQAKVNRLLARIAVTRKDAVEAKRRFLMAADAFQSAGEVGEWDDTMYELSRLAFEEEDYRMVIRLLEEMRGYTRQSLEGRGIRL